MNNYPPPEVNIEVPSDSDSSRRPSKYTLSNTSSIYDMQRRRSGLGAYGGAEPIEQNATRSNNRSHSPSGKIKGHSVAIGAKRVSLFWAATVLNCLNGLCSVET